MGTVDLEFRSVAETPKPVVSDHRYYCSPGALSDYETRKFAPRHIQKLISICAVYFAPVADLLEAGGTSLEKSGNRAIPPEFLNPIGSNQIPPVRSFRFVREMERRFGPLPWFLRRSGSSFFGLPNVSLRDLFWVGDAQPIYVLQKRGGGYLWVSAGWRTTSWHFSVLCSERNL